MLRTRCIPQILAGLLPLLVACRTDTLEAAVPTAPELKPSPAEAPHHPGVARRDAAPTATPASFTTPVSVTTPAPLTPLASLAPPGPGPRVPKVFAFDEFLGADVARTRAAFAPAARRAAECAPGKSGALSVRVTQEDSATKLAVQPGATLDPAQRRCVLESLSTIEMDGALGQGSASDKPTGFSAVLRIEW